MMKILKNIVPIALVLVTACNKSDNSSSSSSKVAIDVNLESVKSGNDLETVQLNGFYLYIDQGDSAAKDYYLKMSYNSSTGGWDMFDAESGDEMDILYWDDLSHADNKVVALYSSESLTQTEISSTQTFASTLDQSVLSAEEFNKQDILYAANSYSVDGTTTALIDTRSGIIDISLRHLYSIIYIETTQEFGTVQSLSLLGTPNGFDLNCADYTTYNVSSTNASITPYLESSINNYNTYSAFVVAGESTVMVELHTTKDGQTVTYNSRLYTNNFVGGGSYQILIENPDELAGSFDISIGEWSSQTGNQFTNVTTDASVQQIIEVGTAAELLALAEDSYGHYQGTDANDYSTSLIRLTANINMDGIDFPGFGTYAYPFKGEFDGNGYTISNLTMYNYEFYQGLFRAVGHGGNVYDLTVENFVIGGDSFFKEEHCYGAVAGVNKGTIQNCKAVGCIVTAGDKVGGVVGENYYGFVIDCSSENCTIEAYDSDGASGAVIGLDF